MKTTPPQSIPAYQTSTNSTFFGADPALLGRARVLRNSARLVNTACGLFPPSNDPIAMKVTSLLLTAHPSIVDERLREIIRGSKEEFDGRIGLPAGHIPNILGPLDKIFCHAVAHHDFLPPNELVMSSHFLGAIEQAGTIEDILPLYKYSLPRELLLKLRGSAQKLNNYYPGGNSQEEISLPMSTADISSKLAFLKPEVLMAAAFAKNWPQTRKTAVMALGEKRDRTMTPYLIEILDRDPDSDVKDEAIIALGKLDLAGEKNSGRIKESLFRALGNGHDAASVALGMLGDPQVIPILFNNWPEPSSFKNESLRRQGLALLGAREYIDFIRMEAVNSGDSQGAQLTLSLLEYLEVQTVYDRLKERSAGLV